VAEDKVRDITQDSKALFELLYLTREWLNKHHYLPMHAKFALGWVYGLIECVSDERWNGILAALQDEHQVLTHRVQALEEMVERLAPPVMEKRSNGHGQGH
jgi:hypothetical protein